MNILIVSDAWHPQVNGVVRTYECVSDRLRLLGHKVTVIGPADFPHTVCLPGYREIRLALLPYAHLKSMLEGKIFDAIHIATEGPIGWAGRRYCKKRGLRFTTCYHTHFPDYIAKRAAKLNRRLHKPAFYLTRAYLRMFHAPSALILVATGTLARTLKSWGFASPSAMFTRGVDQDLFHPGPKLLFNDLKRPIALYVGRVAVEKNLGAFLDMAWDGSKIVVGDGPARQSLSHAHGDVIFAGKKTGRDLADHYRSADLFVFPSRTDTFGIVILEALASGLPVAAYDVAGPRDILTRSGLGVLTAHDFGQACRDALACGGDAETRAAFISAHYSWDRAARQFEEACLRTVIDKG